MFLTRLNVAECVICSNIYKISQVFEPHTHCNEQEMLTRLLKQYSLESQVTGISYKWRLC